ncbi:glycosyltransferase family 4 protein [Vibrio sinaloensis]|uniref:glycosyltransferase family 4 protein n=1 Tax=Photobacterium sp. (strain ATCC 43367) TaxID=379097 RepID=UPI000AEDC98A|nr:glycosyltransferase family 4 protein [Vibrio sinaloensis]
MIRKFINITVATSISGQGGISTVLNGYQSGGFFQKNDVIVLESHRRSRIAGLYLTYFNCLLQLIWLHIFYDVGVVHIHMASRGSYKRKAFIIRLVKLFNTKAILHLHGAEFQEFYTNECSPEKQNHIRSTFDLADAVIVLSTQWHSWMTTIVSDSTKVRVVYNAVETLDLTRTNVEHGRILFLGRLGERKGVKDLIDAFAVVVKRHPHARLALGGDGDIATYKQQVEKLGISDSVDFLGWVSGEQKRKWLSKADIYCLPSYNEGFPMGVLEAMSANIPVVASKAGGIPDAIQHGEEGLLVEAGKVDQLASYLELLISDRDLNRKYAAAAKMKFINNFSKQAVFPELEAIYSELMSK